MKEQLQQAFQKVVTAHERFFDVSLDYCIQDRVIPAFMQYSARDERYFLSKRATLWSAENYEYSFLFAEERLTKKKAEELVRFVTGQEPDLVKPHREHMYTNLTLLILAESFEEGVVSYIKQVKFKKNYKFTFHGWCTLRAAVFLPDENLLVTNPEGKEIGNSIRKILAS